MWAYLSRADAPLMLWSAVMRKRTASDVLRPLVLDGVFLDVILWYSWVQQLRSQYTCCHSNVVPATGLEEGHGTKNYEWPRGVYNIILYTQTHRGPLLTVILFFPPICVVVVLSSNGRRSLSPRLGHKSSIYAAFAKGPSIFSTDRVYALVLKVLLHIYCTYSSIHSFFSWFFSCLSNGGWCGL